MIFLFCWVTQSVETCLVSKKVLHAWFVCFSDTQIVILMYRYVTFMCKLKAGGKPSTRSPPGGLVERKQSRTRTVHATSVPPSNLVASESCTVVPRALTVPNEPVHDTKTLHFPTIFLQIDQKCDFGRGRVFSFGPCSVHRSVPARTT